MLVNFYFSNDSKEMESILFFFRSLYFTFLPSFNFFCYVNLTQVIPDFFVFIGTRCQHDIDEKRLRHINIPNKSFFHLLWYPYKVR
jgi:hypothetical protein